MYKLSKGEMLMARPQESMFWLRLKMLGYFFLGFIVVFTLFRHAYRLFKYFKHVFF